MKQAGVKMDGVEYDAALELFETALALDPNSTDALLHRSNLRMLQQKLPDAKIDLEKCVELRPGYVLARLRLATVYMAEQNLAGAKTVIDEAMKIAPDSSEVHSYKGEMFLAEGQVQDAIKAFEKASEYDASNPTPYVNGGLAILNIPGPSGGMPDAATAIELFEKALESDPYFHAAYVHLGQMRLSMATDLNAARDVVKLYDKGLSYCRATEEIKDLCGMRMLAVAQVDGATLLNMETFNMQ